MAEKIDIVLASDTQEGTTSVVSMWMKNIGEVVSLHEPVVEISTDKVTLEVSAPAAGVLVEILKQKNEEVVPGQVLGRIELGAGASLHSKIPDKASAAPASRAAVLAGDSSQELSPAVRKLLKEHNLEASQIKGSGRGGRITHQDVLDYVARKDKSAASSVQSSLSGKRVPHSVMRKSIAEHMTQSLLHTAPHVTTVFQADLSHVLQDREAKKSEFEKRGAKLTLTAYFISAACKALGAVPEANSRWHEDAIELFDCCNIGIATALETEGLIVPVIKNAEKLDLLGIAQKLHDLTSRARDGKLGPKDVQDGTFTISNHGVSGSLFAAPIIINQPQSAILGIGKLEKRVVVDENGKMVVQPSAYVTLTIDHRVLDGFQANKFLTTFVAALKSYQ